MTTEPRPAVPRRQHRRVNGVVETRVIWTCPACDAELTQGTEQCPACGTGVELLQPGSTPPQSLKATGHEHQEPGRRYRRRGAADGVIWECPECEAEVAAADTVCSECGTPLAVASRSPLASHRATGSTPHYARSRRSHGTGGPPILPIMIIACAVLVVVGSLAPWATLTTFFKISVNGTDGDGVVTLILGVVAGLIALIRALQPDQRRWILWGCTLLFGIAALVGVWDWTDMHRFVDEASADTEGLIRVGWGLPVLSISAVAGALLSAFAAITPD